MVSKLSLVNKLGIPPLGSSSRSRNKSGDVSRGHRCSSLSLANMMSQLTLVNKLGIPPLSSSSRSRNKTGDVSRGHRSSSLSLSPLSNGHMMHITVREVSTGNSLGKGSM